MQRYKQSTVCANNPHKTFKFCLFIDLNQHAYTNTNVFSQIFSIVSLKTNTTVERNIPVKEGIHDVASLVGAQRFFFIS